MGLVAKGQEEKGETAGRMCVEEISDKSGGLA